jgi:hypothetical protein
VEAARDDLEERTERYGGYGPSCEVLTRAYDYAGDALDVARSLNARLGRLSAKPTAGH